MPHAVVVRRLDALLLLPLSVQAALARMTLHDHFQALVTAEDELDTISQRLLTAAVKLGRAPNFCVFFDSSPRGITAAHNCTLKAVAVQVSAGGQRAQHSMAGTWAVELFAFPIRVGAH